MEETPRSTESTAAFTMPQDGDTPNTSGTPEEVSTFGEVPPTSHGPAPIITSRPSFSPSTSSSVHPFKLERFTDNKGNPRTRVYLGRLRYLINNFEVIIQSDTKSTASYSGSMGTGSSEVTGAETGHTHSGTSTVTLPQHTHDNSGTAAAKTGGSITTGQTETAGAHNHSAQGTMAAPLGDHYHAGGGTGVGSDQQLKIKQHTHSLPDITGGAHSNHSGVTGAITSGTGGSTPAHTHDIGQNLTGGSHTHDLSTTPTGNITAYGSSGFPEYIEGNTGGVPHSLPSQAVTGVTDTEAAHYHVYNKDDHSHTLSGETGEVYGSLPTFDISTGSSTGHTHPIPTLTNSLVSVDRFVCVQSQSQGAGYINEVEPTGFTALKDSNDKDTVVKAKTMVVADTYGSFFLKWSITLPTGSASGATIAADAISIHRDADPTKTAEQLQNDFGKMSSLVANSETATMATFKRDTHSEDDRTASYYVKIGVSYDPNAAGTNSKTIEQITYENVYWSPLFISSIT